MLKKFVKTMGFEEYLIYNMDEIGLLEGFANKDVGK